MIVGLVAVPSPAGSMVTKRRPEALLVSRFRTMRPLTKAMPTMVALLREAAVRSAEVKTVPAPGTPMLMVRRT